MNEFFMKAFCGKLFQQMAKMARKRGRVGNWQEKEMAPISI
jgi:hypothetical protein